MGCKPKATISRELPNVLPLDVCRFRYRDSMSEAMPVWKAQKRIREILEMRPIWYNGAPQRYTWNKESHEKDGTYIELEFEFMVVDKTISNIKLAVEDIEKYDVICNGSQVQKSGQHIPDTDYYLEQAMKTIDIPEQYIQSGKNVIVLQMNYMQGFELEDIYLLGNFAVNQKRLVFARLPILWWGDYISL